MREAEAGHIAITEESLKPRRSVIVKKKFRLDATDGALDLHKEPITSIDFESLNKKPQNRNLKSS